MSSRETLAPPVPVVSLLTELLLVPLPTSTIWRQELLSVPLPASIELLLLVLATAAGQHQLAHQPLKNPQPQQQPWQQPLWPLRRISAPVPEIWPDAEQEPWLASELALQRLGLNRAKVGEEYWWRNTGGEILGGDVTPKERVEKSACAWQVGVGERRISETAEWGWLKG